ncbi:MAG: hypothetical protein EA385_13855, partial [Salinarimonadaceae bacterium]
PGLPPTGAAARPQLPAGVDARNATIDIPATVVPNTPSVGSPGPVGQRRLPGTPPPSISDVRSSDPIVRPAAPVLQFPNAAGNATPGVSSGASPALPATGLPGSLSTTPRPAPIVPAPTAPNPGNAGAAATPPIAATPRPVAPNSVTPNPATPAIPLATTPPPAVTPQTGSLQTGSAQTQPLPQSGPATAVRDRPAPTLQFETPTTPGTLANGGSANVAAPSTNVTGTGVAGDGTPAAATRPTTPGAPGFAGDNISINLSGANPPPTPPIPPSGGDYRPEAAAPNAGAAGSGEPATDNIDGGASPPRNPPVSLSPQNPDGDGDADHGDDVNGAQADHTLPRLNEPAGGGARASGTEIPGQGTEPDLEDPLGVLSHVEERRLEEWDGGLSQHSPEELARMARTLRAASVSDDPELQWRRDDILRALSEVERAAGITLDPLESVDLDDPSAIADFVRLRGQEEWDGGLRELPNDVLDRMAVMLDREARAQSPEFWWQRDAILDALSSVRAAGGSAFPAPVPPGAPGYETMPRAVDFGLPDRDLTYVGVDPDGDPVWRDGDGRNVGPFSREPSGEFANGRPPRPPAEPRFPFNPTAPGAIVLAEPPGALVPYDPALAQAARDALPAPQRDHIEEVVSYIRDTLAVDMRLGLNFNISEPLSGLPLTRATVALGIDTIRTLNANRGPILEAARNGDHRALLDLFSEALGVGARLGEAVHEPQVVRFIFADLFGLRGAGVNSAFQWKATTLERFAERSFLGEPSPFRFTPETGASAIETPEPGFAQVTGRLSWNVTPVTPREGEPALVDIFGASVGPMYRVEVDTPVDKTMFELYTPRVSVGPVELPSAEYREELANGLVIPAGALVPAEMVQIFDRAIDDGLFRVRFQTPYRADADGQAEIAEDILRGLDGASSFLDELGPRNVEAAYLPALRARLSAPPGRISEGFRTIDANFLPLEHVANWIVSLATNGEVRLPYDRAVSGELDPAGRFAPDALHGWSDKVRFKLNVGPQLRLGDILRVTPALYFVRDARSGIATGLVRSNEEASLTFENAVGEERSVAVPTWLAMMVGRRVAPGQIEAFLGVNPLPAGGIVVPQGGTASLREYLMRQRRDSPSDEREAIAEFMYEHMGGAMPAIADNRSLAPAVKDELIRLLHGIADPALPGEGADRP